MHVPMLCDLAVRESENIDDRNAAGTWFPYGVHVQDHVIAVNEHPFDLAVCVGEIFPANTG